MDRKLLPPHCLTVWCFRHSMDKWGHSSGADPWVVGPTYVGLIPRCFPNALRAQAANEHELGYLSGLRTRRPCPLERWANVCQGVSKTV